MDPTTLLAVSVAATIVPLASRLLKAVWQAIVLDRSEKISVSIMVGGNQIDVSGGNTDVLLKRIEDVLLKRAEEATTNNSSVSGSSDDRSK